MDGTLATVRHMSNSVDDQFGERFIQAASKAGIECGVKPNGKAYGQTAIGKALGVNKQTAENWMKGRSYPSVKQLFEIEKKFNVDARWLVTNESTNKISDVSEEAIQVARAFDQMQPQTKERVREHVFIYSMIDRSFPWLRTGKPVSSSYDAFERWHVENMDAKVTLEAQRIAKK